MTAGRGLGLTRRLSWRLAFRLARRHRVRSVLLVTAIALPVAVGVAVTGVSATARVSTAEFAAGAFGAADARVSVAAAPASASAVADPATDDARFRALLPPGVEARWDLDLVLPLEAVNGRAFSAPGRALDLADPLVAPLYRVDAGRPTSHPATVVLSSALAERLGVGVGDRLAVGRPAATLTVAALVSDRVDLTRDFMVVPTAAVVGGGPLSAALTTAARADAGDETAVGTSRWLLRLPPAADAAALGAALRAEGYVLTPRSAAADLADANPPVEAAGLALGVGLLAEVALLVCAAFAVVARTQRRQVGLLAVLGAPAGVRRGVLLAYGLLLGFGGALLGTAVGAGTAALVVGPLARRAQADWGALDLAPLSVALLLVGACVTALAAAWWPARALGQAAPVDLLREVGAQPATPRPARRLLVPALFAFAAAGLGVAAASGHPLPALTGTLAGVTGSVLVAVGVAARRGRRDLSRLRPTVRVPLRALLARPGRTVAVGVAVSVVLTFATAVVVVVQSVVDDQASGHLAAVPPGAVLLRTDRQLRAAELAAVAAAATSAPPAALQWARVPTEEGLSPALVATALLACAERSGYLATTADWADCTRRTGEQLPFPSLGVASADDLERLLGAPLDDAQRAAYEAGAAATVTHGLARQADHLGVVRLPAVARGETAGRLVAVAELPTVAVAAGGEYTDLPVAYVSPGTATAHGLAPDPAEGVTYVLPPVPDAGAGVDETRLRAALPPEQQAAATVTTDPGPMPEGTAARLLAVILLVAAATAAGTVASAVALWSGDLEDDYRLLGALGASAGWRRRTGAWHGVLLGGGAVVVGGVWGTLPALAFLDGNGIASALPWAWLAALGVAVVSAAGGAGAALVPAGAAAARARV